MSRNRLALGLPLLATLGLLAACSSAPDPAAPDLASRLEQDTGTMWTVYSDPRSQEVRFLAPATPVALEGATPEDKARSFFHRYRDALHATAPEDLRLVSSASDRRGGTHLRFTHVLPGTELPVFDAGTTVHFTERGAIYWMETDFRADLADVDAHATVNEDEAKAAAVAHVRTACGAVQGMPTVSAAALGVLSDPDTHAALAYRVRLAVESSGCRVPSVFVDARTGAALKIEEGAASIDTDPIRGSRGELLGVASDLKVLSVVSQPDAVGPNYFMVTADLPNSRVITRAFGTTQPLQTRLLDSWDTTSSVRGAAVDGHFFSQQALRFLRAFVNGYQAHGRSYAYPLSLDVQSFVHDNSKNNSKGANAYAIFDEVTRTDTIHFGDGNFPEVPNALPFTAAYDVVAHELTHLVTAHTSNLKYERESGALNESFSDVMGAAAEHAAHPDDAKSFLIGEDLYFPGPPGRTALRSMTSPNAFDGAPDHRDVQFACPAAPSGDNDECYVHTNSGIPNKAFSLIVAGGTVDQRVLQNKQVVTRKRPIAVSMGIGWERAAELTYWATTGLNATASFQNAALAQIAEAGRAGTDAAIAATCAWYAVGVIPVSNVADTWYTTTFCTPPPAPSPSSTPPTSQNPCSGHGSSVVCDPAQANQAIRCQNGAPLANEVCADLAQTCKPLSPSDPTAALESGVLVCE